MQGLRLRYLVSNIFKWTNSVSFIAQGSKWTRAYLNFASLFFSTNLVSIVYSIHIYFTSSRIYFSDQAVLNNEEKIF